MSADLPLTLQQRWLWNLVDENASWKCAVSYAFRINGPLQLELLRAALLNVVQRHDSLRISLCELDGAMRQRIGTAAEMSLEVLTLNDASESDAEERVRQQVEALSERDCDPRKDPLLNVQLLQMSGNRHWLLVAVHRLISDCAGIDQFFRDLWAVYGSLVRDEAPALDLPSLQYESYARAQWAANDDWNRKHGEYWRAHLSGAKVVKLPRDAGLPASSPGRLGKVSAWFDADLSEQLRQFARKERSLAASAFMAAYVTVLWHRTGQQDFVVPFHVAGRQTEQRSTVGYFSHILILRLQLDAADTLAGVMRKIANEFFRALAHQDFGRVATAHPELLSGVYFQWLTWHDSTGEAMQVPEASHPLQVSVEPVPFRDFGDGLTAIPPGMVDMETTFFDTEKGIHASGVYRDDLFSARTMDRFMADLQVVLRELVSNPGARLEQAVGAL